MWASPPRQRYANSRLWTGPLRPRLISTKYRPSKAYSKANLQHMLAQSIRRKQIAAAKKRKVRAFAKNHLAKTIKRAAARMRRATKKGKYFLGKKVNYSPYNQFGYTQ